MKIIKSENKTEVIEEAVTTLKNGGLIIFPTETAYGVGVDATNAEAVSKLLKYKKRPIGKAISIAVDSEKMARKYIVINKNAESIIQKFLPGPVTVVAESLNATDPRLVAESGTLGIRIPNYKLILDIINRFGKPITATSANSSGAKTPYSINDIIEQLSDKQKGMIDLVIDAGELPKNPPSTVIDTTTDDLKVYRQGRIDPREFTSYELRITNSADETLEFGKAFIEKIQNEQSARNQEPVTILLSGELGAGKTHFTKGIAKGLGIEQVVKSPTYTYVSEYRLNIKNEIGNPEQVTSNPKLYHFDAWRVQSKEDLDALRFYDWFKNGNVIVVEWPSVIMSLDEKFFEDINYYYVDFIIFDGDKREIRVYKKINGKYTR